jgi:hypothetical protein
VEKWKGLIKKLIKMRFEDYDKNFRNDLLFLKLSRYILWIESNSKYIILILLIYKKLSFIQLLNDKMDKLIEKKEIKYEYGTYRSPLESKIVNECFFIYNEAMIKLILRETNLFNKIGDNLLGFTNTIKEIYHYSSQLNYELNLFSKELPNLKTFIDIEKIFNQIGEYKEVNIKKLIEILIDKNKLNVSNKDLKKEEINNIFENIKKLHDFLSGIIGKTEHFSKIINELLLGEYLRITDEEFRKLILELILNNPNIIKDSTQIFIKYFNHIIRTNSVDSIENGDIEINNYNIYFEMIENAFNKDNIIKIRLEQMLLNLFESYFLVFFEEIPN